MQWSISTDNQSEVLPVDSVIVAGGYGGQWMIFDRAATHPLALYTLVRPDPAHSLNDHGHLQMSIITQTHALLLNWIDHRLPCYLLPSIQDNLVCDRFDSICHSLGEDGTLHDVVEFSKENSLHKLSPPAIRKASTVPTHYDGLKGADDGFTI